MIDYSLMRLTLDFAESVADMEKQCFSDPWSLNAVSDTLTSGNAAAIGALLNDGTLVGYGMIYFAAEDADIANIAVAPEYRRLGIGGAILGMLIDAAEKNGVLSVYLEVRRSNESAVDLYKKSGFIPLGIRRNYYRSPREDAVIMRKNLV